MSESTPLEQRNTYQSRSQKEPRQNVENSRKTAVDIDSKEPDGLEMARKSDTEACKEYRVVLKANPELKLRGPKGELLVWIGCPQYYEDIRPDFSQEEGTLPAVGKTAKITASASGGVRIVSGTTQCIQIHPTGSSARFELIPEKTGTYTLSAEVWLFDSEDCSGTPVPKGTKQLTIKVEIDAVDEIQYGVKQCLDLVWKAFLDFWGAFLAALFGALLYFFREKMMRLVKRILKKEEM